ncbi:hypothetical protein MXB_2492, partial [Myxobolus squamalis]
MDLPDVFDTIWHNGELRLMCKRNPKDITVEALAHVVKSGKLSKNYGIGPNISLENQSYFRTKLDTKMYGFGCALSMFIYYSKFFTICVGSGVCVKLSAVFFETNCEFLGNIKCVNSPGSFWIIPFEHPIFKEVDDEI